MPQNCIYVTVYERGIDLSNPYLSIVTPTYNRGHLLTGCYQSLCSQTDKNFEWIIVDDGSSDHTEQAVKSFPEAGFPVVYVKKENEGKHTALNASHPYIRGRYVLILDSDDQLTQDAVSAVRKAWNRYEDNREVGVVTFHRSTPEGQLFATVSNFNTPVDIMGYPRKVYLGNDCCEVIRSELFLKYPFPVFPEERFLSEGALWNRVARTHKCVYINDVIYICEYLEGGLTKAGRAMRIRNPRGGMFAAELGLAPNNNLKSRIKSGLLYTCYGYFAGLDAAKILGGTRYKLLAMGCLLPGYLLYRFWKRKYMENTK